MQGTILAQIQADRDGKKPVVRAVDLANGEERIIHPFEDDDEIQEDPNICGPSLPPDTTAARAI